MIHISAVASRTQNWLASGSFDRTIKLWDLAEMHKTLIMMLLPPDAPGPKLSIYATATDPAGKAIASGGPERVIRTWDSRAGKQIGKPVGHTDNICAILISEDARYVGCLAYGFFFTRNALMRFIDSS